MTPIFRKLMWVQFPPSVYISILMGSYTVGVAGQTVNLLPLGSGGATPSLPTINGTLVKLVLTSV